MLNRSSGVEGEKKKRGALVSRTTRFQTLGGFTRGVETRPRGVARGNKKTRLCLRLVGGTNTVRLL